MDWETNGERVNQVAEEMVPGATHGRLMWWFVHQPTGERVHVLRRFASSKWEARQIAAQRIVDRDHGIAVGAERMAIRTGANQLAEQQWEVESEALKNMWSDDDE